MKRVIWLGEGEYFFEGELPPSFRAVKEAIPITVYRMDEDFEVKTPEGKLRGGRGDYLLVGERGELRPCRKEIFEELKS